MGIEGDDMSEKKFFVGQDVFIDGGGSLRPAKIARITPSGQIRLEGGVKKFDKNGWFRGHDTWQRESCWLVPSTPELVEKHMIQVKRAHLRSRVKSLTETDWSKSPAEDLDEAARLVTDAVNILNNPKLRSPE